MWKMTFLKINPQEVCKHSYNLCVKAILFINPKNLLFQAISLISTGRYESRPISMNIRPKHSLRIKTTHHFLSSGIRMTHLHVLYLLIIKHLRYLRTVRKNSLFWNMFLPHLQRFIISIQTRLFVTIKVSYIDFVSRQLVYL